MSHVVLRLPENASIDDLTNAVEQLSTDLHSHTKSDDLRFALDTEKFEQHGKQLDKLVDALGLDDNPKHAKPVGLWSQTDVVIKFGSIVAALFALWKIIGFSWPFLWKFLIALNTYVMK